MQLGHSLDEACRRAMLDLQSAPLPELVKPIMNFVALDAAGKHAGYSTVPGRKYLWQTPDMAAFKAVERTVVDVG